MPSNTGWVSVTYGEGQFVAVAYGSAAAAYSYDGVTWALTTMPLNTAWTTVTYGEGRFVAVAGNGNNEAAYTISF
jgi:hypothetical protein